METTAKQRLIEYLKKKGIGQNKFESLAGLSIGYSHVGRRTAGSIWLNSGIPIDVVAKCLGHQSIQVTQRAYAKILDTTVVEAFRRAKT